MQYMCLSVYNKIFGTWILFQWIYCELLILCVIIQVKNNSHHLTSVNFRSISRAFHQWIPNRVGWTKPIYWCTWDDKIKEKHWCQQEKARYFPHSQIKKRARKKGPCTLLFSIKPSHYTLLHFIPNQADSQASLYSCCSMFPKITRV